VLNLVICGLDGTNFRSLFVILVSSLHNKKWVALKGVHVTLFQANGVTCETQVHVLKPPIGVL